MIKTFIAGISAAFFAIAPALAEDTKPLTSEDATRFVASLESVEALGKELEADGKLKSLAIKTKPVAGEAFKPYSNAVAALKEDHPADHARLAAAVKPHGFTTEEWGHVGDRVMVAYLAEKMEQENPGALAQARAMDPAMLDMMPAHAKAQMESVMVMISAVENAPADDRKAIKPVMKDLDAMMKDEDA